MLLISGSGYSQEFLTLEKAKSIALSQSPLINELRQNLFVWKWRVREADSRRLPRIDLTEIYSRTDNPTLAFSNLLNQQRFSQENFNIDRLNNPSAITNYNTKISISLPLFNAGMEWIEPEKSRMGAKIQREDLEWKKQMLLFNVTRAYYEVLYAEAKKDVLERAIATSRKNFSIREALYKEGMVVKSDYLSSLVNLASLEQEMVMTNNALRISIYNLNHIMWLPIETAHEFPKEIVEDRYILPEVDELIREGMKNRPDYK